MLMNSKVLRRRGLMGGIGAALAAPTMRTARAATSIKLGFTATLGFNGAFIAKDRGLFAKHGLDVELQLIGLNSNIPGAMMGGSIQVGGPTPTVLLQANDGGLDLLVVCGCAAVDPDNRFDGLLVRKGAGIARAADCVGKKIGVPGLNAYHHVIIRKWLTDNGVDWRQVNFIEVQFTQSADILRSGSVDAVATGEPFSTRIASEGIGTLLVRPTDIVRNGTPTLFYAATRDWAMANGPAIKAFKAAIAEASQFQASDPDGARGSAGKFIKLPPEVMKTLTLPVLQPEVSQAQVGFWIDEMAKQGMIQDKPNPAKLIAP